MQGFLLLINIKLININSIANKYNNYNLNLGKVEVKLKRKANSVKFKKKQKI